VATLLLLASPDSASPEDGAGWIRDYRPAANRLITEATSDTFAWRRLAALTDIAAHRLSGSPELERAIAWTVDEMKRDGLENVHTEKVRVQKWIRGRESAEVVAPARHPIAMLGLGGSEATPRDGLVADALVVRSFEELDRRAAEARGRIVVLNAPFTHYGESVRYRSDGPSRAARHGAVGVLVRSIGPDGLRLPHTGAVQYDGGPHVPAAAIASEDADRLQRLADRGDRIAVRLQMESHYEGEAESANVVGELRGRERPDEIVVVSGHLDSWDVGSGASDDGGGCIVTWEALRILKKLNLRPRRTVRVVLFTNEENGGRGGAAYRDRHRDELSRHVAMLESDNGVFRPLGFGVSGSAVVRRQVAAIAALLDRISATEVGAGGEGGDIAPSVAFARIPALSLEVDSSRFFVIHHTAADTVDKIDPAEMAKCAAAVTVMAYVLADMPQRLGD
jgi:carboxypeptidase Q